MAVIGEKEGRRPRKEPGWLYYYHEVARGGRGRCPSRVTWSLVLPSARGPSSARTKVSSSGKLPDRPGAIVGTAASERQRWDWGC